MIYVCDMSHVREIREIGNTALLCITLHSAQEHAARLEAQLVASKGDVTVLPASDGGWVGAIFSIFWVCLNTLPQLFEIYIVTA